MVISNDLLESKRNFVLLDDLACNRQNCDNQKHSIKKMCVNISFKKLISYSLLSFTNYSKNFLKAKLSIIRVSPYVSTSVSHGHLALCVNLNRLELSYRLQLCIVIPGTIYKA